MVAAELRFPNQPRRPLTLMESAMAIEDPVPEFTARDVGLIDRCLPDTADPRRRQLLPQILHHWSSNDLFDYLKTVRRATPERRKRVKAVGTCARELLLALEAADDVDLAGIAGEMMLAERQTSLIAGWAEIGKLIQRIEEEVSFLDKLAEGAARTWDYGRGQPPNITANLVVQDSAAIFEWLTNTEATREVDRDSGAEIGPFQEFLAAIWPVVFRSGDDGLPAAMKNWASLRRERGEKSALIANIAMRNPTWGIFER
jgi:hypothetical protein